MSDAIARSRRSAADRSRAARRWSPSCALAAALLVLGLAPASAGSLTGVAPGAASESATIQVTGTGFNISAAKNDVTFIPASGSPVVVQALTITTLNATTGSRLLTVRVPGLATGPAQIEVTNTETGERSAGKSFEVVALSVVSATSMARGQSAVELVVRGTQGVGFRTTTRVVLGTGVTIGPVTVVSPTELRSTFSVASDAAPGARTLTVVGTSLTAILPNAITITDAGGQANQPPVVTAGAQPALISSPLTQAQLSGSATDDGLPPGSTLTYAWSVVSGPGPATLRTPASASTAASFARPASTSCGSRLRWRLERIGDHDGDRQCAPDGHAPAPTRRLRCPPP